MLPTIPTDSHRKRAGTETSDGYTSGVDDAPKGDIGKVTKKLRVQTEEGVTPVASSGEERSYKRKPPKTDTPRSSKSTRSTPSSPTDLVAADKTVISNYIKAIATFALKYNPTQMMATHFYYVKQGFRHYYQLHKLEPGEKESANDIALTKDNIVARKLTNEVPGSTDDICINPDAKEEILKKRPTFTKDLRALLQVDYIAEIMKHVAVQGYWCIPASIFERMPALKSVEGISTKEEEIPSAEVRESAKQLFMTSKVMLEKFCRIKIKELISFNTNNSNVKAATKVRISVLTQIDHVVIVEAVIAFASSSHLAVTLVEPQSHNYSSILKALDQSSWFSGTSSETNIRFADHPIEESLVYGYFKLNDIEYGLVSSEVTKKLQRDKQAVNFWERLAYKRKSEVDLGEIDELDSMLEGSERELKRVDFTREVKQLASFRTDIGQMQHVEKIVQNQRLMRGTLLHLPTGFGKTFIMYMVMAQHRRKLQEKGQEVKPYLLVVCRNNVAQSWEDNFRCLNGIMLKKPSHNIFDITPENKATFENFCAGQKSSEVKGKKNAFLNYCLLDSRKSVPDVAVAVTVDTLNNAIDSIFIPTLIHPPLNKKNSAAAAEVAVFAEFAVLLDLSEITSTQGYIFSDRHYWKKQIDRLFVMLNNYIHKLTPSIEAAVDGENEALGNVEDYFYPQRGRLQQAVSIKQLDDRAVDFSEDYYSSLEENKPFRALASKLYPAIEFTEQLIQIYYFIVLYFQSKHIFKAVAEDSKINIDKIFSYQVSSGKTLLDLLDEYKKKQQVAVSNYQKIIDRFNGLFVDESEQVLVESTSADKETPTGTEILLNLSLAYQRKSRLNSETNPIIVASSATPWPNNMREFSLHMKFLLPKLLGEHAVLHAELFRRWGIFESLIDSNPDNEAKNRVQRIIDDRTFIETQFQQWVRMFYRAAVSYEAPQRHVTNVATEEIFYVGCDERTYAHAKLDLNPDDPTQSKILNMISDFYNAVIYTTEFISKNNPNPKQSIFNTLSLIEKSAFYVETHQEAVYLAMQLTDYFTGKGVNQDEIQIGLFYDDKFVLKQGKIKNNPHKHKDRNYREYENATFNTDRGVNRNTFNNIVRFEDFYYYIGSYLNMAKGLKWSQIFQKTKLLDSIEARELDKKLLSFDETLFFTTSKRGNEWKQNPNGLAVKEKFITFLKAAVELTRHSEEHLIMDFSTELEKFRGYLPEKFRKIADTREAFYSFRKEYTLEFKSYVKKVEADRNLARENGAMATNPFDNFIHIFLHYLTKLCQSNIFIFGKAGTSGMRIDADRLIILSGAWTEGRLTQVKGRVGRAKGNDNRPCRIQLPLSNTLFENFILRFHTKKSMFDALTTAIHAMTFGEIVAPLALSYEINRFYRAAIGSGGAEAFIDDTVHQRVSKILATDQNYLALGPYDKALRIVPAAVKKALDEFNRRISALPAPETAARDVREPEPTAVSDESDAPSLLPEYITTSWGEAFSEWIAMYAVEQGWSREGNEGDCGSILRALVCSDTFEIRARWRPTGNRLNSSATQRSSAAVSGTKPLEGIQTDIRTSSRILTVNQACEEGVAVINMAALEENFLNDRPSYQDVFSSKGHFFTADFQAEGVDVQWPENLPDELYVELSVPDNSVRKVRVEPLQINGRHYELYGELVGGDHEHSTHFWTYRNAKDGYYLLDDLKGQIHLYKGQVRPVEARSRIFRFVESRKLEEQKRLQPKRLINKNQNCFINAAFQLADSPELRKAVLEFMQSVQSMPNLPLENVRKLQAIVEKEDEKNRQAKPPIITPFKPERYVVNKNRLAEFINADREQIILLLPTRGAPQSTYPNRCVDGDLETKNWIHKLNDMLKQYFISYQFLIIVGMNRELTSTETADSTVAIPQPSELDSLLNGLPTLGKKESVFIIPAPFTWRSTDRLNGKVPLGQMRNYCLDKAAEVYQLLVGKGGQKREKVSLLSMDADTELTRQSLQWLLRKSEHNRYTVKTAGYEMGARGSLIEPAPDLPPQNMSEAQWSLFWRTFLSHTSMQINSRLTVGTKSLYGFGERNHYLHFGYCCEPAIHVETALTERLFASRTEGLHYTSVKSDSQAPFGHWDNEGRRFRRYLSRVVDRDNITAIDALGPSYTDRKDRPLLRSHERFYVPSPAHRKWHQQLSKDELAWVISNMVKQPQHLIKPWFTGSNIANTLRIDAFLVRAFASYFYANNLLLMLNLGPRRAYDFSTYLYLRYLDLDKDVDPSLLTKLSCDRRTFVDFINKNFFGLLLKSPDETESVKFRQFATILARWSIAVATTLTNCFGQTFTEEMHAGQYSPMTFPENYPSQAVEKATEDEGATEIFQRKKGVKIEEKLDRLYQYFEEESGEDFLKFPGTGCHSQAMSKISPMFRRLANYKNRIIIFVDQTKPESDNEAIKNLLHYANTKLLRQEDSIALCMDAEEDGSLVLKLATLADDGTLKLENSIANHESIFSVERLLTHCDLPPLQSNLLSSRGLFAGGVSTPRAKLTTPRGMPLTPPGKQTSARSLQFN